jgi:hypothetical protein
MNRSSWEMTNEGRPMPMPMHNDMYNHYYQTAAYPGMMAANYQEDMRMRRVGAPAPAIQYSSNSLLGLPGGNADNLMQQLHSHGNPSFDDGQLDPMLLAYDGIHHSEMDPSALHHSYRNAHPVMLDAKLEQRDIDSLLDMSPTQHEYRSGPWQSDPTMVSLEQESEFDKWMGEQ